MQRRGFLAAMLAASAAPAFVRADSLMRIVVPKPAGLILWGDGIHDDTASLQGFFDGRAVYSPAGVLFAGVVSGKTLKISDTVLLPDGAKPLHLLDSTIIGAGRGPVFRVNQGSGQHIERCNFQLSAPNSGIERTFQ